MLDRYTFNEVPLLHQTSDKRLLRTNGEGNRFLTGFKTWSHGSSDLHSERVEVERESLLSKFIKQQLTVKSSLLKLIQEGERLKGTSVPENWPKWKIVPGRSEAFHQKADRKIRFEMADLKLRPRRSIRKKRSNGPPDDFAVTGKNQKVQGWAERLKSQIKQPVAITVVWH